jgi:hypothetical protein
MKQKVDGLDYKREMQIIASGCLDFVFVWYRTFLKQN